jgi:TolA-binding protein
MVMSNYELAMPYFQKTAARCPKSSMGEEAEFEIAECLSKNQNNVDAYVAYKAFAEKYPGSKRAKIAARAAQLVQP